VSSASVMVRVTDLTRPAGSLTALLMRAQELRKRGRDTAVRRKSALMGESIGVEV